MIYYGEIAENLVPPQPNRGMGIVIALYNFTFCFPHSYLGTNMPISPRLYQTLIGIIKCK
jgi:hypothetical protein